MKHLILLLALGSGASQAHDEGHGPKLSDTPKQGGKVAPVIAAIEISKGTKAQLIYKAELVRTEADLIKVYLYDKEMNRLSDTQVSKFAKGAVASVEQVKKGKIIKTSKFDLELKNGLFEGKLGEKPKTQTFNIDVKMKEDGKDLLAAFDGLESKVQ